MFRHHMSTQLSTSRDTFFASLHEWRADLAAADCGAMDPQREFASQRLRRYRGYRYRRRTSSESALSRALRCAICPHCAVPRFAPRDTNDSTAHTGPEPEQHSCPAVSSRGRIRLDRRADLCGAWARDYRNQASVVMCARAGDVRSAGNGRGRRRADAHSDCRPAAVSALLGR